MYCDHLLVACDSPVAMTFRFVCGLLVTYATTLDSKQNHTLHACHMGNTRNDDTSRLRPALLAERVRLGQVRDDHATFGNFFIHFDEDLIDLFLQSL